MTGQRHLKTGKVSGSTDALAEDLFELGQRNASIREYERIVDGLLNAYGVLDTELIVCDDVINARFPKGSQGSVLDETLRKRLKYRQAAVQPSANRSQRLLAVIKSLWSPAIVEYYHWANASEAQLRDLKRLAERYQHFARDFVPRANAVLVERHENSMTRSSLSSIWGPPGPGKPSSYLQRKDLHAMLKDNVPDNRDRQQLWVQTSDPGKIYVAGKSLSIHRKSHAKDYLLGYDKHGMIVPRGDASHDRGSSIATRKRSGDNGSGKGRGRKGDEHDRDEDEEDRVGAAPQDEDDADYESEVRQEAAEVEDHGEGAEQARERGQDTGDLTEVEGCGSCDAPGPSHQGQDGYSTQPEIHVCNAPVVRYQHNDSMRKQTSIAEPREEENTTSTIGILADSFHQPITLAQQLHNKHRDRIRSYEKRLRDEAARRRDDEHYVLRAQWLNKNTRWAKIHVNGSSGSSCDSGMAASEDDADVCVYTAEGFWDAAEAGKKFDRPILIQEKFTDSKMHDVQSYTTQLRDGYGEQDIELRCLSDMVPTTWKVRGYCDVLQEGQDSSLCALNALNLHSIVEAHRPRFTYHPRFQLLKSVCARKRGFLGKQTTLQPYDVSSCDRFNILGMPGAFSGAHVDALVGTWLRNLAGVKFWMIVPASEMDGQWERFASEGSMWTPEGRERLIVLEPDDVLLMPPGTLVLHAVHTPEASLMDGGMLWDTRNILQTLNSLYWVSRNQLATNESIPWQLPQCIRSLKDMVLGDLERFNVDGRSRAEFETQAKELFQRFEDLGCRCWADFPKDRRECDDQTCSCIREQRRCTDWCKEHPRLPSGRSIECMNHEEGPSDDDGDEEYHPSRERTTKRAKYR